MDGHLATRVISKGFGSETKSDGARLDHITLFVDQKIIQSTTLYVSYFTPLLGIGHTAMNGLLAVEG